MEVFSHDKKPSLLSRFMPVRVSFCNSFFSFLEWERPVNFGLLFYLVTLAILISIELVRTCSVMALLCTLINAYCPTEHLTGSLHTAGVPPACYSQFYTTCSLGVLMGAAQVYLPCVDGSVRGDVLGTLLPCKRVGAAVPLIVGYMAFIV